MLSLFPELKLSFSVSGKDDAEHPDIGVLMLSGELDLVMPL